MSDAQPVSKAELAQHIGNLERALTRLEESTPVMLKYAGALKEVFEVTILMQKHHLDITKELFEKVCGPIDE